MSHKEYLCIFPSDLFSKHMGLIWIPKHLGNISYVKHKKVNASATFHHFLCAKGFIPQLCPEHNSILYLESDPKGIDASSPIGQCGSPVPDVRQMFIPRQQVQEWSSQGALVLGTGHDEVVHNQRCKREQEKDARQGKPVHLPAIQTQHFVSPGTRQTKYIRQFFQWAS